MSFLALSLGISTKKGGKVSGLYSLAVIFVYYVISLTTENMVLKGSLSPFLGMWSANIFLLILGIILYYYSSREKTLRIERSTKSQNKSKTHPAAPAKKTTAEKTRKSQARQFSRWRVFTRFIKIIDLYVAKKLILLFPGIYLAGPGFLYYHRHGIGR